MSFLQQRVHFLHRAARQWLLQLTKPDNHALALNAGLDLTPCKSALLLENALFRQQLIVFDRQIKRPQRAELSRVPSSRKRALSRVSSWPRQP